MKSTSEWNLMKQGQFELAYQQMTQDMIDNPNNALFTMYNRALCLLQLNRPQEALADFQKLIALRQESDSGYIGAGIAFWWLNQSAESVETWKRALNAKYTDAAGGIEIPAFLLFAASRLHDVNLEKDSIKLLKTKYKTKRASSWPGPIAGFLLGNITEEDLLEKTYQQPALQARMLTKAHFWIGVSYFRQNNIEESKHHFHQSYLGDILEPEYYLAKYELQSLET